MSATPPLETVVVIDDEAPIRRFIDIKLSGAGYQVAMAADGQAGLELIRKLHPAVVITDMRMPTMDGDTLCRMIAPLKEEHPFLTVVISGSVLSDADVPGRDRSDVVYLAKPFTPQQLLDCLDKYFGRQRPAAT